MITYKIFCLVNNHDCKHKLIVPSDDFSIYRNQLEVSFFFFFAPNFLFVLYNDTNEVVFNDFVRKKKTENNITMRVRTNSNNKKNQNKRTTHRVAVNKIKKKKRNIAREKKKRQENKRKLIV